MKLQIQEPTLSQIRYVPVKRRYGWLWEGHVRNMGNLNSYIRKNIEQADKKRNKSAE